MDRTIMETLKLFPTELFVFQNPNIDNEGLIEKLKRLDNIEIKRNTNVSLLVNLKNNPDFKHLFDWFSKCLEEIRVTQKYDCDKIEITNSWVNVAMGGYDMHLNYHKHSMSLFSAVYYMTYGSPTLFEDPVQGRTNAQLEVLQHDFLPWYNVDPVPGKLIIFPSWMYHSSARHIGNTDRYIISFNSLPTGKINYNLATDSRAHIKVIDD